MMNTRQAAAASRKSSARRQRSPDPSGSRASDLDRSPIRSGNFSVESSPAPNSMIEMSLSAPTSSSTVKVDPNVEVAIPSTTMALDVDSCKLATALLAIGELTDPGKFKYSFPNVGSTVESTSELAAFKADAQVHGLDHGTFNQSVLEIWVRATYGDSTATAISFFNKLFGLSMSVLPTEATSNVTDRHAMTPANTSTHWIGRGGQKTTGDHPVTPTATRATVVNEAKLKLNTSYGKLNKISLMGKMPVDVCSEARDVMTEHLAIVAACDKNLLTGGWKTIRELDCDPNVLLAHLDMFLKVYMALRNCGVFGDPYTKDFFGTIEKATASSGHAGLKIFLLHGTVDLLAFLKPHVGGAKILRLDELTKSVVVGTDTIKSEVRSISHLRMVLHFIIQVMYMLLDTRVVVRQHMKEMHTSVDLFCDTVLRIGPLIAGAPAYYFAVDTMQKWLSILIKYFTDNSRKYQRVVTVFNPANVQFAQHISFAGDGDADAHVKAMAHLGELAVAFNFAREKMQVTDNATLVNALASSGVLAVPAKGATNASRTLAALVLANAARNNASNGKAKKSVSFGFSYKALQKYATKHPKHEVMNDTIADNDGCTYSVEVGVNGTTTFVEAKVCHVAAANGPRVKNLMGGACPDFTCKDHNAVYGTRTAFTAPASKTTASGKVVQGIASGCITNATKSYLIHTFK